MSLEITNALGQDVRLIDYTDKRHDPPQKKKMRRIMLRFACVSCGLDIWVHKNKRELSKHRGRCRPCSSKESIISIFPVNRGLRKRPYEWLLHRVAHSAASRDISCTLTYEEFLEFTRFGECHYCGSEVTWTAHNMAKGHARSNLDRKDNSLGYFKENLVVACIICNRMKNNYLSYEDMMELSPVLRRILPQKNWVETHKKQRFGHHKKANQEW